MKSKPEIINNDVDAFINAAKDESINKIPGRQVVQQNKATDQEEIDLDKPRRQTYYITELYIQAIEQMAFYEKMDKSEIVRKALEEYIPRKYINLAIKK